MPSEPPSEDAPRRRRRGPERVFAPAPAATQPRLRFAPVDLVSKDELESVHQAALTVLADIGIDILHDEARALLEDAGAELCAAGRVHQPAIAMSVARTARLGDLARRVTLGPTVHSSPTAARRAAAETN